MLCFSQQLHQTWTTGRVANSERPQWTYGLPGPNQRKKVRGTVQARGCVFLFFSFLFLTECIGVGVGGVLVLFFFRGEGFPIEKKKLRCPDAVSMMLKPRELVKKDILFTSGDEAR